MKYDTNFKSVKDEVSAEEWQARVELAACYRLVDQYEMTDLIFFQRIVRFAPTDDGNIEHACHSAVSSSSYGSWIFVGSPVAILCATHALASAR